jgi:hypothetical protein
MTVPSEQSSVSYTGNGSTTVFAIPYYFLENTHLKVIKRTDSTGAEVTLTLNVDYTLTGAGVQAGGTLTATVAPATGTTLVISRNVPATQETDYPANDPFPSASHERALDKLTMLAQQGSANISKALRVPDTDPEPARLPPSVSRANLLLGFGSSGNPIAVAPVSGSSADLALSLANFTDSIKGAGQVGYSATPPYPIDTVGKALRDTIAAVAEISADLLRHAVMAINHGVIADGVADDTAGVQAAIDSVAGPVLVLLPMGTMKVTGTIFLKKTGVHLIGAGFSCSKIRFVNAAGGTLFSGDVGGATSLVTINECSIKNLTVISDSAANDASVIVEFTSFAYSEFNIGAQTKRTNAVVFQGQGNNGSSPYYNRIKSPGLFGGDGAGGINFTQTALLFAQGLWAGGSNGPNANIIGPINRAAGFGYFGDIRAGNGNLFSDISAESMKFACFRLNFNPSVDSGTSSGSNGQLTLADTAKAWTVNAFVNYGVRITGGAGAGQSRLIGSNTATVLTLREPWGTRPDATSTYSIYANKAHSNKITGVRLEGHASNNPDFIYALPGTYGNEVSKAAVESLGSGLYVRDESGTPRNSWYNESRFTMVHSVLNPGNSANIDVYPKNSVFGGASLAGNYVLEWVKVSLLGAAADTCTVRLDVGGASPGAGDTTLTVVIPSGGDMGMDMPASTQKIERDGTNRALFLNLQTGAAFGATNDVNITYAVTLT